MSIRIYIFAPYRNTDPAAVTLNVLRAIEVGEKLAKAGFDDVFIPHLYHYWDTKYEHPHEFWMRKCLLEVRRSDVLVGCGSMSEGCDAEVAEARLWHIPVYYTADEYIEEYRATQEFARKQFGLGGLH
jgi:hypothetical protein